MKNDFDLLKKYVEDDRGLTSLLALENVVMIKFQEQVEYIKEVKQPKQEEKPGAAVDLVALKNGVKETFVVIKESAQEFISFELKNYHQLKAEFDQYSTWIGIIIVLAIFAVGTLRHRGGLPILRPGGGNGITFGAFRSKYRRW